MLLLQHGIRQGSFPIIRVECMTDFRPNILTNLCIYRGIVEDPDRIEALNDILNELDASGFGKLVQNFCTQTDPERADDFLFEIWICQMLRRRKDVQALQYEPSDATFPPDFRFLLQDVSFGIQVKRLHNTKNEITRRLFVRECRKRLSNIQKPWLINFWVADHFTRQHLNTFFAYLRQSLNQFSPVTTFNTLLGEPQYLWKQDGRILVRFSFIEKPNKEPGIFPGVISLMTGGPIDTDAFRAGVERLLKKSRNSLTRPVSSTQANLLVMQVAHPILFAGQTMPDALYASNGLFRSGKFSNSCGLILVPSQAWCFNDRFEGIYFPNPVHLQTSLSHPKPFEEMVFYEAHMRMYIKWQNRSSRTSREPESWVPEAIADLIV